MKEIVLVKSGVFYNTFNDDASILNKLFGYKINNSKVGFPEITLFSVILKLRINNLSVIVVYNKNNIISYI